MTLPPSSPGFSSNVLGRLKETRANATYGPAQQKSREQLLERHRERPRQSWVDGEEVAVIGDEVARRGLHDVGDDLGWA